MEDTRLDGLHTEETSSRCWRPARATSACCCIAPARASGPPSRRVWRSAPDALLAPMLTRPAMHSSAVSSSSWSPTTSRGRCQSRECPVSRRTSPSAIVAPATCRTCDGSSTPCTKCRNLHPIRPYAVLASRRSRFLTVRLASRVKMSFPTSWNRVPKILPRGPCGTRAPRSSRPCCRSRPASLGARQLLPAV